MTPVLNKRCRSMNIYITLIEIASVDTYEGPSEA